MEKRRRRVVGHIAVEYWNEEPNSEGILADMRSGFLGESSDWLTLR